MSNQLENATNWEWNSEKAMAPHSSTLAWKIHGWRSLVGCSPWGRKESETTERLHFHFLLSCIGEGNGNPLHCSCLENPRDGGAWWAAVYGVAQSRTQLKRLRSSSCSILYKMGEPWRHYAKGKPDTKTTYFRILFIWNVQNRQILRKQINGCWELRAGGNGE